jgi:hypothetical protein
MFRVGPTLAFLARGHFRLSWPRQLLTDAERSALIHGEKPLPANGNPLV